MPVVRTGLKKEERGKPRAVVEGLNFHDVRGCWSPDGRRIAYTVTLRGEKGARGGETSLQVVGADGKGAAVLITAEHRPERVALMLTGWR